METSDVHGTSDVQKIENIRHSLAHLLAAAVLKKYPEAKLGIGPTIENGFYYDFYFAADKRGSGGNRKLTQIKNSVSMIKDSDPPELEKEIRRLIKEGLSMKGEKVTPAEAKKFFKNQPFKLELIQDLVKEKKTLTIYSLIPRSPSQISRGEIWEGKSAVFADLCRGGHAANTSEINPDAFKLTHTAGAYWKGNEKNPQLQRIYGVAFETKEELEKYLWQQNEAKKRDHRKLGEELKLFTFAKEVGPGLPLWLPNGTIIRDEIEKYAKEIEKKWGYKRVTTPHIAKEDLYKISGHIPYYAESMYPPMKLDDGNYYLKAMNCPHTHMIYKAYPHSYRELPIRYAEYGTVYRHELSGTLTGLLRVRGFSQNDAHIYCSWTQAEEEFLKVMKLHEFWYKEIFGINDFYMRLSLPAKDKKKYADIPKGWRRSVEIVRSAMKKSGLKYVEAEGEAAFYGPKVDFQIKSVIGREETASTNQLDFLATERFNLTYVDKDGKDKPVYVIHRAPLGSHERFIAFLIEHFAGVFPLWLSPVQARVLAVSEKHDDYAKKAFDELEDAGIRAELTLSNETLGKRIREAQIQKIPYVLVVGDKEKASGTVAVRHLKQGDLGVTKLVDFKEKLLDEIREKKF